MNLLETMADGLSSASSWLSQTVNNFLIDPPFWGIAALLALAVLVVMLLVFRNQARQPTPDKHAALPPPPPARATPDILLAYGRLGPTNDEDASYRLELCVSNLDDAPVQLFELALTSAASGETLLYEFVRLLPSARGDTFSTTLERPAGSRLGVGVYLYAPGQRLFRLEGTLVYREGEYRLEPLSQQLVVTDTLPSSQERTPQQSATSGPKRNRIPGRPATESDFGFPDDF